MDAFRGRVTEEWEPRYIEISDVILTARALATHLFYEDGELSARLAQFSEDPFGLHGPGAVFDHCKGRDKWLFDAIPGLPESKLLRGQHGHLKQSGEDGEPSCRLAIVPKDFRGHRLICVEPKEFMFYQQGLMRVLVDLVHNHWLTSRSIDFKDQSKSFALSRSPNYSTIDLSDASDNLRLSLARHILPKDVWKLATLARSRSIELPDGDSISYTTLFPMGNALCFPFQTIIFFCLSLATILIKCGQTHRASNSRLMREFLSRYRIRVFGDDIIVPRKYFNEVCDVLSRCGLKVNWGKSCHNTPVREACGSWYYYGVDARIVRLRTHRVSEDKEWCGTLQAAKLLFQNGFSHTGDALLSCLDEYYPVPYGVDWVPGKIPWGSSIVRYNIQLQRVEVRIPIVKDNRPDVLTDEIGLYSYFTGRGSRMAPHHSAQRTEMGWAAII